MQSNRELPTQDQFVKWCEDYYFDNRLEPGNPLHGDWEVCHFPAPACLGGQDTVLLLKEHHAIQGVLQSEECGHPCIWGWELSYLPERYKDLGKKWLVAQRRIAQQAMTKSMTPGQLSARNRRGGISRAAKTNSQKWRCMETGFISTPGPLSIYQKKPKH